jgi:hypothetical protein
MLLQQRLDPSSTSFAEQQNMEQARKGYKTKKNELRYAGSGSA